MAAPTVHAQTALPALLRAQWGCIHWPAVPRPILSPWSVSLRAETRVRGSMAVPHGSPQALPTWRCYEGHSPCLSGAPARMGCSRVISEKACRLVLMGQGTSEQDPGKMKLQCNQVGNTSPSPVPPCVPGGASKQRVALCCVRLMGWEVHQMTERVRSGSHPSAAISFVVTEPIWRTLGHSHLLWFQGGRWLSISLSPALCS